MTRNDNDTRGICEMCETPHPSDELTSKGGIIAVCDDCIDEDGNVVYHSQDTKTDK